jgi:aerobic carbon-monoxide dehydrogenase medium subunit
MHRFEYAAPASLAEAVALLDRYGATARVIAGGTDLLTALKERWERPAYVISLGAIPGLSYITYDDADGLHIGAGATVRQVETSPIVCKLYPVLALAASTLASIQIRNLATVAGNICRASPSADMPPALLALDAAVQLTGPAGERTVPLAEFFTGPGRTVLSPNEILCEVQVPPVRPRSGAHYIKHSPRRAMDLATVGVAAALTMDGSFCCYAGLALGAVAPTPRRSRQAEALLIGQNLTPELLDAAAASAAAEASPISDVRSSALYRRKMVRVLARRSLRAALAQAQGDDLP